MSQLKGMEAGCGAGEDRGGRENGREKEGCLRPLPIDFSPVRVLEPLRSRRTYLPRAQQGSISRRINFRPPAFISYSYGRAVEPLIHPRALLLRVHSLNLHAPGPRPGQ